MPILRGTRSVPCLSNNNKLFSPALFQPSLWIDASASSPQTDGALGLASASSQYGKAASLWVSNYPFTFSTWVKWTSGDSMIFCEGNDSTGPAIFAYVLSASGKVHVTCNNDTTNVTTAGALTSGTWANVLITYDGTTCNIYLNGTKDANSGALANNLGSLVSSYLGVYKSGTFADYFNGLLACHSIWNRVVTSSEIALLAAGILPTAYAGTSLATGLVDAYPCTQPSNIGYGVNGNTLTFPNGSSAAAGPVLGPCAVAGESIAQFTLSYGNGAVTYQGTVANRFLYEPNAINGQVAFQSPGTSGMYALSSGIALTGAFTAYAVGNRATSKNWTPWGDTSGNGGIAINSLNDTYFGNDSGSGGTVIDIPYTGSTGAIAARWRRDSSNRIWFASTGMAEAQIGTVSGTVTINNLLNGLGINTSSGQQFSDIFVAAADMVTNGQAPQLEAWINAKYGLTIP